MAKVMDFTNNAEAVLRCKNHTKQQGVKTRGTFNQHGYSDNSSESSVFLSMTFKWYSINFL